MTTRYRVTFEIYDESMEGRFISSAKILDEALVKPTNCFDYGMGQKNQIALIQSVEHKPPNGGSLKQFIC